MTHKEHTRNNAWEDKGLRAGNWLKWAKERYLPARGKMREKQLKIRRNAAMCLKCKSVIESTHVHDFVSCYCGAIFVDGGREYLRRGGELANIKEMVDYVGD